MYLPWLGLITGFPTPFHCHKPRAWFVKAFLALVNVEYTGISGLKRAMHLARCPNNHHPTLTYHASLCYSNSWLLTHRRLHCVYGAPLVHPALLPHTTFGRAIRIHLLVTNREKATRLKRAGLLGRVLPCHTIPGPYVLVYLTAAGLYELTTLTPHCPTGRSILRPSRHHP